MKGGPVVLTKLEVYGPLEDSDALELLLAPVEHQDYLILGIFGLNPVAASVSTTSYAASRGDFYGGSKTSKRNILLTLAPNPDDELDVSDLRTALYEYFMPENHVRLRFFSEELPTCEIEGYVESFDPNMFSKDPEFQISVICPQPDFIAVAATVISGLVGDPPEEFTYAGSIPTGFVLDVESSAGNTDYTGSITVTVDDKEIGVTETTVDAGDLFRVSTVIGEKYIRNVTVPGGVATSLLGVLLADITWIQLTPGVHEVSVEGTETGQTWELSYFARYGGL
jgi:hypothetical protein